MVLVGNDDQGRDAKTPAVGTNRRYFGLISADIDHKNKRVDLLFRPKSDHPTALSDGHRQRCLIWCLDALAELREAGYLFSGPEAVKVD